MNLFVAVALGGAAGACLRYAIVLLVGHENQGFPYATLIANVIGCVAIGVLLFLIDQREFLKSCKSSQLFFVFGGFIIIRGQTHNPCKRSRP